MANITLAEILQPQYIVDTISKIRVGRGALSSFFGFQLGSPKIAQQKVDVAAFRIFNETRVPSTFRLAGVGPAVITPNPVGEQRYYLTKMYEKMVFPSTLIGNLSKIDGPNAEQDVGGVQYLADQQAYIGKRFNMGVEFLTGGMARGAIYLVIQGDQLLPQWTQPNSGQYVTVSFGVPATNINQLSMGTGTPIIDVSWDNPAANIVKHILSIQAAMAQQTGMQLRHIVLNSITWNYVINNVSVRTVGGIMDTPFEAWTLEPAKDEHGNEMFGAMKGKIRAVPWVDFLIVNDSLAIGGDLDPVNTGAVNVGTLNKVVPDGVALFTPTPDPSWCQMVHGGEWVAENEGVSNWVWKQGLSAWKRFNSEPTSISIVSMLKAIPLLKLERAFGWGSVVYSGAAA